MTLSRLALQSLRYHFRAHLGVLAGATLGIAILVGALAVGDSVRESLNRIALARLGRVHLALVGQSRFFREGIAYDVREEIKSPIAPLILLNGAATNEAQQKPQESVGAARTQVLGVTEEFWTLGGTIPPMQAGQEGVVLNDRLAAQLGAKVGQEILLRVDKPSLLSRDAPLSTVKDAMVAFRLPVAGIVNDAQFGRFSLIANQIPPLNVYVPLGLLQKQVGMEGRTNTLLVGAYDTPPREQDALASLWKHWKLEDASLSIEEVPASKQTELRTSRVFIDPPIAEAALRALPNAEGVLTYFVNEIRLGTRSTPYSTIAAMQGGPAPADLGDDEVVINAWLAEDLQAKVGDSLELKYWVVGTMRKLEERKSRFRVRAIIPLAGKAADANLMPDIPGLSDKKNCRDWEPGVPVDLDKIRDKDQAYWTQYRGTPKAFMRLSAGQKIWNNRFGNLTAVRYPANAKSPQTVSACIRQALNPTSLGLFFVPVREQALSASANSLNFGLLFIGFSLFLIVAALLLTALLFAFGVERRSEEMGILLAMGFPPNRVQRLLLSEGMGIAAIAAVLGTLLGVLYTKAVLGGLSSVWSGAVMQSNLVYSASPRTLLSGAFAGFETSVITLWLATRRLMKRTARELLALGGETSVVTAKRKSFATGLAVLSLLGAVALTAFALMGDKGQSAGLFFGAGALLLIGGLALCRLLLSALERGSAFHALSLTSLGIRNNARRWGRSLNVIGLLAVGSFLVIGVGANRHDPNEGAERRDSGTGGFALYGETTLPVFNDLNTAEGRENFRLEESDLQGANIVAMRLRQGDDASCLNLNRAQAPRLLGVDPQALQSRKAFGFAQGDAKAMWNLLDSPQPDGAIPVLGDMNTVVWSLGKSLGATLDYKDERGETRKLRIVGVLGNCVLQGSLVMSEPHFVQMFPSQSGYQVFLADAPNAPKERVMALRRVLTLGMEDAGAEWTIAADRMANFNSVENTYLSIFAILGGLGLLLGSAGLGVVVLRNTLERRGELGLLRAVGFPAQTLQKMIFQEHLVLLLLGLAVGIVSAMVAVLPSLRTPGAQVPVVSLGLTLLAVFVSGFVWTWLATAFALRSPVLKALRNE